MSRTYRFVVGQAEAGLRLDHYLVRHLSDSVSRSLIQRGIRQGTITVSSHGAKTHSKLRIGDVVTVTFNHLAARSTNIDLIPENIPLHILYEDAHLLVVNKPAGLVTHPAPGHWSGTLVNAVLWHLTEEKLRIVDCGFPNEETQSEIRNPKSAMRRFPLPRAGIVHRLDKDTSGLLIVAKTQNAHTLLSRQLKARTIKRRYLAIVEGHLPLPSGTVDVSIGRHLTHRKEMTVRHLGGRTAVTHYRVLKRLTLADCGLNEKKGLPCTLLELTLETGRTHQIRVHMAHLGHPVVGDVTYGKHSSLFWHAIGVKRQLLHAYAIRFVHPATQKMVELSAPIPEDIRCWVPIEVGK